MVKINVIGFDGLHRVGKGTQIQRLRSYLAKKRIYSVVVRGDGTRGGVESEPYDFHSEWWLKNRPLFLKNPESLNERRYILDLKSCRLNREGRVIRDHIIPREISKKAFKGGAVMQDRTFVSRLFTMRQYYPNMSLEDALNLIDPNTQKKVSFVMPDLEVVLHGDKSLLLERARETSETLNKYEFKKRIIEEYYDLFSEILNELISRPNFYILDTSKDPDDIHLQISKLAEGLKWD